MIEIVKNIFEMIKNLSGMLQMLSVLMTITFFGGIIYAIYYANQEKNKLEDYIQQGIKNITENVLPNG